MYEGGDDYDGFDKMERTKLRCFQVTPYLDHEQRKNLHHYRYAAGDTGILYNAFFDPFAKWCVDTFIPPWIAPNVLTLTGFIFSVGPAIFLFTNYGTRFYN